MNWNRTLVVSLTLSLVALALLSSCGRRPEGKPLLGVAQVGDVIITVEQVERKLADRQRAHAFTPLTAADREAALAELVQAEVLFAQAQRAGWHTNAELLAGFKRAVVARFRQEQFAQVRPAPPTEAEIREAYERQAAQFTRAGQTRAAVILLETPTKSTAEKRAETERRAAEVHEQAIRETAGLPHFGGLAQRYSVEQATRYAGGDFGLLPLSEIEGRYGAALSQALAALKAPGDVSAVVETPRGLGFVKLIERRPASRRPLSEVRDGIAHQLAGSKQAQAERDWIESAKKEAAIRIDRAALESIPLPNRNSDPPALPGTETVQVNR